MAKFIDNGFLFKRKNKLSVTRLNTGRKKEIVFIGHSHNQFRNDKTEICCQKRCYSGRTVPIRILN